MTGINVLDGLGEAAIGADVLFVSFLGIGAILDGFHHLAQVHKLIADDLALIVEGRNLREVARFVSEKLSVLKDVTSTSTHFILKKYKNEGVILDREKEKREELI